MSRYPVLYLPTEIHNRDWDARLLIADYASARGFTSVVGQQWIIHGNAHRLPPGLMLIKTINEIQLNAAKGFMKLGHAVLTMDEEALAVAPDQNFLGVLSPRLPEVCHAFIANSPLHAEAMQRLLPAIQTKVVIAGNPRLDLLVGRGKARFAADADAIKASLGPFVLFNSNMAQANSIWSSKEEYFSIQVRAGGVNPNNPKSVERFNQQFEFERSNSVAFMNSMYWCLENLRTHRVVVRPHPVERVEFWHDIAAKHPSLYVAANTHHVPWLMAADVLVHTNSTTGLEAAFLGTPAVNLVPNAQGMWENIYVGTRVNPTFVDWQEAVAALQEMLTTGGGRLAQIDGERAELRRYFPAEFDGCSAERFVDFMESTLRSGGLSAEPFDISAMLGGRLPHIERADVLKRKFSKEFPNAVEDFNAIRRATGLAHKVAIAKLGEHCFAISPAA